VAKQSFSGVFILPTVLNKPLDFFGLENNEAPPPPPLKKSEEISFCFE
jgi:hypothetical protein